MLDKLNYFGCLLRSSIKFKIKLKHQIPMYCTYIAGLKSIDSQIVQFKNILNVKKFNHSRVSLSAFHKNVNSSSKQVIRSDVVGQKCCHCQV